MIKWIRRRIGRQLLAVFYVVLLLVSVTSFFVYDYMETRIESSRSDLETISEKNRRADTLWDNWQNVQFGLRGFVIFGDQERFDEIEALRTEIKSETDWFGRRAETDQEEEFAAQMLNLYDLYYGALFPLTQSYVTEKKANRINEDFLQGDSLFSLPIAQRLVEQGQIKPTADGSIDITPDIEKASSALEEYRDTLQQQQEAAVLKLRTEVANTQWIWISSIFVLISFILLFVHPFIRRMTKQQMTAEQEQKRLKTLFALGFDRRSVRTFLLVKYGAVLMIPYLISVFHAWLLFQAIISEAGLKMGPLFGVSLIWIGIVTFCYIGSIFPLWVRYPRHLLQKSCESSMYPIPDSRV